MDAHIVRNMRNHTDFAVFHGYPAGSSDESVPAADAETADLGPLRASEFEELGASRVLTSQLQPPHPTPLQQVRRREKRCIKRGLEPKTVHETRTGADTFFHTFPASVQGL